MSLKYKTIILHFTSPVDIQLPCDSLNFGRIAELNKYGLIIDFVLSLPLPTCWELIKQ